MEPPDQEPRTETDVGTPHDAAAAPLPGEDAYTAPQAARVLGLSDRRVRQMLEAGELEGERDGSGKWWIPQRAAHAALEDRGSPRVRSREQRAASPRPDAEGSASAPAQRVPGGLESVRELIQRVESLSYRLGRSEARAELTERAESTLREERDRLARELKEERAERRRLAERLERLEGERGEDQEVVTTPVEIPLEDSSRSADVARPLDEGRLEDADEEEATRRPWWLRWLGG
ncbi:MAG: hypothetical protein M3P49_14225 [Actinomycetota bacterium]|nr:hypothetical protein [Actinomycetota bacterium]